VLQKQERYAYEWLPGRLAVGIIAALLALSVERLIKQMPSRAFGGTIGLVIGLSVANS